MDKNQTPVIGSKNLTAAQKREPTKRGLKFKSNKDGTCTLVGTGLFLEKEVLIPALYKGMTVTEIASEAFKECKKITKVIIPGTVTSIGEGAFSSCDGLTSITLPFVGNTLNGTSNTHFGYIFGASSSEDNKNHVPKSLKTVVIAGGSSIGDRAFYKCSGLTSITIPDSVTGIGKWAFAWCTGLTSITIPDSVTSIGDYAFSMCTDLTSIEIPDSVTSIGRFAFSSCTKLTSIEIPDSVTSIGYEAFSSCSGLTSITFNGTEKQWNAISKGNDWKYKVPATKVICSDGNVLLD